MKHLLAITIALLPSAVLAQQFTPQQMLDVMTKSPENRDVRVHDSQTGHFGGIPTSGNMSFGAAAPANSGAVIPGAVTCAAPNPLVCKF
tara:strand:+ start:412 stop:678 length:267 start_codon:yes stop_codon:yes gene_type:complete